MLSGRARFVVRPSNRHLTAQVIEARPEGDRVLASAHSSELKEFGWKGPCGNLPAAYLTGLLAGTRAKARGIEQAILDIGLSAKVPGTRTFAAAKGAADAGLDIPHEKAAFPSEDRTRGEHIAEYSRKLSADLELYKRAFSTYAKQKIKPETLPEHFVEVQAKIGAGSKP